MIIKLDQLGASWKARISAPGGWKGFFGRSRAEALGELVMHYQIYRPLPDSGFDNMTLETRHKNGRVEIDYADGTWEMTTADGKYYQRGRE